MADPPQHEPDLLAPVETAFHWASPGLLLPETPCSFVARVRASEAFFPEHPGYLSVKAVFHGEEIYAFARRRVAVSEDRYLVLNGGSRYASEILSDRPVESLAVFFDPAFASDAHHARTAAPGALLEGPPGGPSAVPFFEQLYDTGDQSDGVMPLLRSVRSHWLSGGVTGPWLEERLHLLLDALIVRHARARIEMDALPGRPSARAELYRRLHAARDFMDTELCCPVRLADTASAACLSPHYFLRAYRRVFGETPHQYLTRRRLERARALLRRTDLPVTEVCLSVGFESLGSFTTLFRRHCGLPPSAYRKTTD